MSITHERQIELLTKLIDSYLDELKHWRNHHPECSEWHERSSMVADLEDVPEIHAILGSHPGETP